MAVDITYIDVPFTGGVDEHSAESRATAPNVLVADNATHRRPGSIGRRDKYEQLSSVIPGASVLTGMSDDTIAVFTDQGEAYTVDPTTGDTVLTDSLAEPPANIDSNPIFPSDRASVCHCTAISGGVSLYVWHFREAHDDPYGTNSGTDDPAGVYYALKDTATGQTIKTPTRFNPPGIVDGFGDFVACYTVSKTNAPSEEVFLVVWSIPNDANDPWAGDSRTLFSIAVDPADGELLGTGVALGAGTPDYLLWDSYNVAGDSRVYVFASESSNGTGTPASDLNLASSGNAFLYAIQYDDASGANYTVTDGAFPTSASYTTNDLVCVYHDDDNATVFLAFAERTGTGPDTWDINVTVTDEALGGSFTTPVTVMTSTGTPEMSLDPYNWHWWAAAGSSFATLGYEHRFYHSTYRAAFTKVDDTSNLVLLVNGISINLPGTNAASLNSLVGAEWCAIKMVKINQAGAVVDSQLDRQMEPNTLMVCKPWWDGEQAHVVVATSPPTVWGAYPDGSNIPDYAIDEAVPIRQFDGGAANQGAYYVAQIPTDVDDFLKPEAVFLVDDALSGKQYPTLWNGSMPVDSGDGIRVAIGTRYGVGVTGSTTGRESFSDFFYKVTRIPEYGSTGEDVKISLGESGSLGRLPVTVADDTAIIASGSMAYFDGTNMRNNTLIPIGPRWISTGTVTGSPVIRDDFTLGVTYRITDARGNIHRTAEQYVFANEHLIEDLQEFHHGKYAIPPLSLYKPTQRSIDSATRVALTNRTDPAATQSVNISPSDLEVLGFQDNYLFTTSEIEDGESVTQAALVVTGELQPEIVNGAIDIVPRRGRVFFIDEIRPHIIRYSKLIGSVTTVEFNNNLQVRIPESDDGATALAVMDDKVIVFTADKTYYFSGDGPNNLGEGGFTDPRPVASSHGCVNQKSVVSTHMGVFFESRRGIMLLKRDLSTEYIGAGVQTSFADKTVVAAVEDPVENEVRFICQRLSDATRWDELVFNQDSGAWSTWTDIELGRTRTPPIDATVHRGTVYVLTADGIVHKQDRAVGGGVMSVKTPWLGFAGIQGFQRVKELHIIGRLEGSYGGGYNVTVTFRYNYGSGDAPGTETTVVVLDGDSAFTSDDPFTIRVAPTVQKCESMQIELSFGATAPSGPGGETTGKIFLEGIGLEVGVKGAGNKIPRVSPN